MWIQPWVCLPTSVFRMAVFATMHATLRLNIRNSFECLMIMIRDSYLWIPNIARNRSLQALQYFVLCGYTRCGLPRGIAGAGARADRTPGNPQWAV